MRYCSEADKLVALCHTHTRPGNQVPNSPKRWGRLNERSHEVCMTDGQLASDLTWLVFLRVVFVAVQLRYLWPEDVTTMFG